eukprot:GFUD01108414.1.p1 GENE.GFUD01108414.1~~GFUD01108414.1.p1  ORF type:complete len:174 (-),score=33.99 GFUD01108414.1:135-656(-)
MGSITAWIVFSGLCLALASAGCEQAEKECEKKGGECSWKDPGGDLEKSGLCREGKWGEGEYCFCGYCWVKPKPCEQVDTCKGECSKKSPGKGWISTSYCDRSSGCKCWTKFVQPKCSPDLKCMFNRGTCVKIPEGKPIPTQVGSCKSSDASRPCYCIRKGTGPTIGPIEIMPN